MKLHIIVIAYNRPVPLRILVDSFIVQHSLNPAVSVDWDMVIVHDGPASEEVLKTAALYKDNPKICFIATDQRMGNWGHANRREMLQIISGEADDFVLITNDDNYYVPRFIELFFEEAKHNKTGMIYCDFIHHNFTYDILFSKIKVNHIDMGAFIVNMGIAQEVGFVHDLPESDGLFAEECAAKCREKGYRVVKINKPLFIHN